MSIHYRYAKDEKERLEIELENTKKAIKQVQETIDIYKKKAQELSAHYNYVKGGLDLVNDIISYKEYSEDEVSR